MKEAPKRYLQVESLKNELIKVYADYVHFLKTKPRKDDLAHATYDTKLIQLISQIEEAEKEEPEINLHFFRSNILRNLTKEEFIILRDWMNSYNTENEQPEQSSVPDAEDAKEFLIKELNLSKLQAETMYSDYVNACAKYATLKLKAQAGQGKDVYLIHKDGNTTRLYKNGVKVSPEKFTQLYGCEMTPEQKELLEIAKTEYFESLQAAVQKPSDNIK